MQMKSFIGRYGVLMLSMFTISLGALIFASTYGKKMVNESGVELGAIEPASGEEAPKDMAANLLKGAKVDIKPGNPVVAVVDSVEIKRSEVFDMIDQVAGPQQTIPKEIVFPMVLDQFVNGKIVEIKADKADVSGSELYKERMMDAKKQIARAVFIEQELDARITEESVKAAYDKYAAEQGAIEELKASHILLETEDDAKAVIKSLTEGGDFASIAKEKSKGPSGVNGGDLGYFKKGDMVPEFETAAYDLEVGSFSKAPVKTQFGYHVIQLNDKRGITPKSFDEMRPELEGNMRNEALQELLGTWREEAKVTLYDINGEAIKDKKAE